MNQNIRILLGILIVLWMIVVFCFSHQPADQSSETSQQAIQVIVNVLQLEESMSEDELKNLIAGLKAPIRKMAHFAMYFVGGVLICLLFATINKFSTKQKILLSQCVATGYAVADEVHQALVPGRGPQLLDIGIDSVGAFIGIMIVILLIYLYNRRKKECK